MSNELRRWMRLVEGEINLPHVFYHATSTTCFDNIKQNGLLADPANRVYPQGHNAQSLSGVYLATNFYSVLLHAENAVDKFGGKPLIFIVGGDIADTHMDEDHLRLFMQDFLETVGIDDAAMHAQMKSVLRQLYSYFTDTFEQPPPKAELAAWFKHVLEHGDEQRSGGAYHQLIDAVARKTTGALLDFVPAEEQSVRYLGNIGFTGTPCLIGALVIDKMAYNLQAASRLPAHMLFGRATEELQSASQITLK